MAIQKIQYTNKEQLVNDTTINDKYKCKADDLNEIKTVVNNNADEIPSNDNLVNVGSSVDTDYKVNVLTTKNLINLSDMVIPGGYSDTGYVSTTNYITIQYVKVKPSTTYTLSTNLDLTKYTALRIISFDDSKTFLRRDRGTSLASSNTFTTENDAYYVAFSFYTSQTANISNITQAQCEIGTTATTYEPFIPNTINVNNEKYTDTINVGTSINDKNRVNVLYSSNIFNNVFQQGGLDLGSTGGAQVSDIRIRSEYILVEPNTTYTISIGTNNLTHCGIGLYKSNRAYDSTHKISNGSWNTFPITFTTESDTQYIRVAFRYGDGNVITPNGDYKVQINEGYKTTYEPYITPSINIDGEEIYNANIGKYSTNEINTGMKWIDGKDIYRKVITFTINDATYTYTTDITTASISDIWINGNSFGTQSTTVTVPVNAYHANNIYCTGMSIDKSQANIRLYIRNGSSRNDISYKVILEYTKTS
jgi:hypothetical protein